MMRNSKALGVWLGIATLVLAAGCGEQKRERARSRDRDRGGEGTQVAAAPAKTAAPAAAAAAPEGWGGIKGRIVWGGSDLPDVPKLEISKDKEWCAKDGEPKDPSLQVDPKTKGIKNVVAFLKKPAAIHPDFPKTAADVKAAAEKKFQELNGFPLGELESRAADKKVDLKNVKAPVLLDQVHCIYKPFALAVREGEPTVALNYEPISHNIMVASIGGANGSNINMPPGKPNIYHWKAELQPLNLSCSIHGWMKAFAMVFDHPYFDVSKEDGSFEIKNVPAGEVTLLLRDPKYIDPKTGKVGREGAKGAVLTIKPGETLELGEIKYTP